LSDAFGERAAALWQGGLFRWRETRAPIAWFMEGSKEDLEEFLADIG
jgi:hypothetical protein